MPRKGKLAEITTSQLREIVGRSKFMMDVLREIGLSCKGTSNYTTLKGRLRIDNIDYTHFGVNAASRRHAAIKHEAIPLAEILVEHSAYHRGALKKRLIKDGLLKNECRKCGLEPEWDGQPLVLELDHINGVPDDNRIDNLRLLCPNCHSQTETFAAKRRKPLKVKDARWRERPRPERRVVKNRPDSDVLRDQVATLGYCGTARLYGVSDNAVRKWLK